MREIVEGCYGVCVDRRTCEPASCDYDGETHPIGESFPANDGCNTCTCSEDGLAMCTLMACACDYGDPYRSYVSKDPEECTRIDFMCAAGLEQFTDQCGCGCEGDA